MRKIEICGIQYPVHASMNVKREFDKKAHDAEDLKEFLADTQTSLWLIATLINEAVNYESVMNGRDIRNEVPHYPLTMQKIGMMASAADLNRDETVQAIAEEFAECLGTEKNFTAAQLKQMATIYLGGQ